MAVSSCSTPLISSCSPRVGVRCVRSSRKTTHRSRAFPDGKSSALLSDPYDVLGVASDASHEEIKLAFRKQCKTTHPDVNPSPNAAQLFRRVNKAYAFVGDKTRRHVFDKGNDAGAFNEGFAPSSVTRRDAEAGRFRNSGGNANDNDAYWDGVGYTNKSKENIAGGGGDRTNPNAVAVADAELKKKGERKMAIARFQKAWTVWCTAWFVVLTVGVPSGAVFWAIVGAAKETVGNWAPTGG